MRGLLGVRPGRLLIASALGVAVAVEISRITLRGLPLRSLLAPSALVASHPLVVATTVALACVGFVAHRRRIALKALRARALPLLVEANRRFAATSDETTVRRRLAETIAQLTGLGVAVSGPFGLLQFRAGKAAAWRGGLEAELMSLAQAACDAGDVKVIALGAFRARTDGLNPKVFGAAVWAAPRGSRALADEVDHYAALLIELASAAIVRQRLAQPYAAPSARSPAALSPDADARSGRLVTMGRFPAA